MKAWCDDEGAFHVELSRRNLESLLAKLDGYPNNSACTIMKRQDIGIVFVSAAENDEHYGNVTPGVMHYATEARIREN